jgi:diguanylate cyclase (GGDEF)-like protein
MTAVSAAVQAVFQRSREELSRRVGTLEDMVAAMGEGRLDESLRASSERDAHKLAGSLGMFGLPLGSQLAREVEQALAGPDGPAMTEAPRLAGLVLTLRSQLDGAPSQTPEEEHADPPQSDGRALLVVSVDPVLAEQLCDEARRRNLRPRSAASTAQARALVAAEAPDAAVLDLNLADGDIQGLELLAELGGGQPPVPVVVLTGSEALIDRVEVARRGGRAFIHRTQPAGNVIEAVTDTIARRDRVNPRLLVVDDDPAILRSLVALLTPLGLEVTTLSDPLRFWERLETITPDLLVLDLDMPGMDGIDLCRAVRADVRFGQLAVLFLTARTDAASVQRIFGAGADDHVTKPIAGPELVTRIQNRLERVRLYRELAEQDSLTGVASRRASTAALERLIAMAGRFGQPLSIALVDLDHFKAFNDRLGHAAGDDALRRIGAMFTTAFRGEDVIGRWGGEEFALGTYGMARDDGIQRVAELLEGLRGERFRGRDGRSGRISFSAGVAEFPRDGATLHDLYRAADDALYRAKAEGRNRVLGARRPSVAPTQQPDVVVVEDDAVLASLLIDALQTRGHRTRWLHDGQEAVAALAGATPGVLCDLIVLDIDLPGLDGLAVLRRLVEDGVLNRTRVIMLTARSDDREVLEALELGAFDHVVKPCSVPVLMQRVRRALAAH